jgi:hypothetical protein
LRQPRVQRESECKLQLRGARRADAPHAKDQHITALPAETERRIEPIYHASELLDGPRGLDCRPAQRAALSE